MTEYVWRTTKMPAKLSCSVSRWWCHLSS